MKRKSSRRIKTRELLRPEQICTQVLGDDLDYYYSKFRIIFNAKGKTIPNWPDFCFAPIGCFFPFVFNENPDVDAPVLAEKVNLVSRLAGLIPWAIEKSIFRFSPTLLEYLIESGTPEKLPSQVLKKLPFWSIYIETPALADSVCIGFFAYLESNEGNDELRLILDTKAGPISLFLHLVEGNLDDSFEKATRLIKPRLELMNRANPDFDLEEMKDYSIHIYKTLLPLVLYICAENAEIRGNDSYAARLEKFQNIDLLNLKEAERPTIWNVGNSFDKEYKAFVERESSSSGLSNSKRPHLRRAHWHSFWRGKRNSSDRELILHFLSDISVNS
ncbi:hypothetical protein LEP1GSC050_0078 [Leptospira phage vB_LbrZ_5399-LE1]|uniref:AcrVA2 family anti-CRISPR protein n=1 Tax=Leptospira inadai TaxID=29506 RepID=UPI000309F382|nr:hypothetical protein [Leptospira inadai]AGS80772.1 hypothetical protein LEP1GSC050_0078 [Leptospira phage vB_LbrZ_5399-LE1]AGS80792.1 hypothetical protein LEP1GSC047_0892 [Leptospira phage vB_LinZ_10-LE1]